jgi:hypothetical protein
VESGTGVHVKKMGEKMQIRTSKTARSKHQWRRWERRKRIGFWFSALLYIYHVRRKGIPISKWIS